MRFVDGLIAHEHLWWDQASLLVQLDLLAADGLPCTAPRSSTGCALSRTARAG